MKYAILGAGAMGQTIAEDIARRTADEQVLVIDIDSQAVDECTNSIDSESCAGAVYDITNEKFPDNLINQGIDTVINALPHETSVPALEACIEAKVDAIDLAFEDKQWELAKQAADAGVTIVPGCGVAPGLSNIIAGRDISKFDNINKLVIKVGGLPTDPQPPLEYRVVFHLDSVWNEYTQPARVIRENNVEKVDPLSSVNSFSISSIENLESFPTDGLGTLLETSSDIDRLEERTIRYSGHANKIRTLRECGLFDTNTIDIEGCSISPRKYITKLLTPKLVLNENEQDLTILQVDTHGTIEGKETHHQHTLVDYYDEANQTTSMARTTGYTASIVAQMVSSNRLSSTGLIPPERIGKDEELFDALIDELSTRDVIIDHREDANK